MAVSRGGHFLFESSPLLRCVGGGNLFEETPRDGGWGIGGEVQLRARVHFGLLEARNFMLAEDKLDRSTIVYWSRNRVSTKCCRLIIMPHLSRLGTL